MSVSRSRTAQGARKHTATCRTCRPLLGYTSLWLRRVLEAPAAMRLRILRDQLRQLTRSPDLLNPGRHRLLRPNLRL